MRTIQTEEQNLNLILLLPRATQFLDGRLKLEEKKRTEEKET